MSLTKCTAAVDNVSSLPDKPALTAAQLKAKFDKTGSDIKDFLNNTLTDELDTKLGQISSDVSNKVDITEFSGTLDCSTYYPMSGGYYNNAHLTYPTGFTRDNSYVLSIKVKDNGASDWKDINGEAIDYVSDDYKVATTFKESEINVMILRTLSAGSANYKILIGKKP